MYVKKKLQNLMCFVLRGIGGAVLVCILTFPTFGYAIKTLLPSDKGQVDYSSSYEASGSEGTIISLIQNINYYLWFIIGFFALVLLVYGGFKLITAQGDKNLIKPAYDLVISAIVILFISVLSYSFVQLIINLF